MARHIITSVVQSTIPAQTPRTEVTSLSRIIRRPADLVTLVPDPDYGQRPQRIRWVDRLGIAHEVLATAVQDRWLETGTWWEEPGRLRERQIWRVCVRRAGLITIQEALWLPAGSPERWWVERIED